MAALTDDDYVQLFINSDIIGALDENRFNLQLKSLFSIPEAVKAFEKAYQLPITGDYKEMISNYNDTYYTSRCSGDTSYVCLLRAIRSGLSDVVETYLPRLRDFDEQIVKDAIKYGRMEILELIMRSNLDFAGATLVYGIDQKNQELINKSLEYFPFSLNENYEYSHYFSESLELLAQQGDTKMVRYFVSNLEHPDYTAILMGAIPGNQIEIIKEYRSYPYNFRRVISKIFKWKNYNLIPYLFPKDEEISVENLIYVIRLAVSNDLEGIFNYIITLPYFYTDENLEEIMHAGLKASTEITSGDNDNDLDGIIEKWFDYFASGGATDFVIMNGIKHLYKRGRTNLAGKLRETYFGYLFDNVEE